MEFNFKDALKLAIENQDDLNNSNMCLISRNPFNSFNFIKLSCGHLFQYDMKSNVPNFSDKNTLGSATKFGNRSFLNSKTKFL